MTNQPLGDACSNRISIVQVTLKDALTLIREHELAIAELMHNAGVQGWCRIIRGGMGQPRVILHAYSRVFRVETLGQRRKTLHSVSCALNEVNGWLENAKNR